jgi:hypothetical protein
MNLNYKKSAKILLLLLSSILIASVSAQVYRYMYIDGSVTVGTAKLIWLAGENAPGDYDITGSTATIDLPILKEPRQRCAQSDDKYDSSHISIGLH